MKIKLLFLTTNLFLIINVYAQTFQKSFYTNNQQHYHDLNTEPANDGTTDFFVAGNIFDSTMQIYTPIIKRVDDSGNILWVNTYSSTLPNARLFDVEPYRAGTAPPMLAITGSVDVSGVKQVFIAKVDAATGSFVNAKNYEIVSPNFNSRGLHISYTENDLDGDAIPDEGFVVGGFFSNTYLLDTSALNIGFVMRVATSLSLFWTIEIDSSSTNADYDMVNHVTETIDGYFVTGATNDISTSQQVVLAHKIDFQGSFVWDQSYRYGNSRDVSVDAYFDSVSQNIYMLSNYSASHYFGITTFDNLTGAIDASQSWVATANEYDRYGFTIMESLDSNNNLVITGYDRDENWINLDGTTAMGVSNLFIYEFEKATGNQVGLDNYQYLVPHVEPVGDEFNFWIGQMPLIYYPDISFHQYGGTDNLFYYHIDYRTDTSVNFTEANMFKTKNDKRNECEKLELSISPSGISINNVTVISGPTPNIESNLVLSDVAISYVEYICGASASVGDFETKETSVYPNPANDYLYFKIDGIKSYTIVDTLGRVIDSKSLNTSNTIYLGDIKNGIYFIKLFGEKDIVYTSKFIKK